MLEPDDPRHGTTNGYNNLKCRCSLCRKAWTKYLSDLKSRRQPLAPDDPRHGTDGGYRNWGCKCGSCKAAHARSRRDITHGRKHGYVNWGCRCDLCRAAYDRSLEKERRAKERGLLSPDNIAIVLGVSAESVRLWTRSDGLFAWGRFPVPTPVHTASGRFRWSSDQMNDWKRWYALHVERRDAWRKNNTPSIKEEEEE